MIKESPGICMLWFKKVKNFKNYDDKKY